MTKLSYFHFAINFILSVIVLIFIWQFEVPLALKVIETIFSAISVIITILRIGILIGRNKD